jgi:hypothetical protein
MIKMIYKIFIGAASKDNDLVVDLAHRLKRAGYKVLAKKIQSEKDLDNRVRDSLGESNEVFILLTDHSLNSSWVTIILGAAYGLHKPITGILVGVREHELPVTVHGMRHIKYPEFDDYISELQNRSEKVLV